MSFWTPGKVDRLRTLWKAGKTANQIFMCFDGEFTRNAIIDKAHRLGLPGRANPIKLKGSGKRPAQNCSKSSRGFEQPRRLDKPAQATRESDKRAELPAASRPAPARPKRTRDCQWTDSNRAPWVFCGEPATDGSWCAAHAARVWQKRPEE